MAAAKKAKIRRWFRIVSIIPPIDSISEGN